MFEVIIRDKLLPFLRLLNRNEVNITSSVLMHGTYRFVFDNEDLSIVREILDILCVRCVLRKIKSVEIAPVPGQLLRAIESGAANPNYTYLGEGNLLLTRF